MKRIGIVAATLLLSLLSACEASQPSKEDIGMATGAILGGVIGHQVGKGTGQTVATIGGAALGGYVGKRIGQDKDQAESGGLCREFTTVMHIDGKEEVVHGTACKQPDGTWKAP